MKHGCLYKYSWMYVYFITLFAFGPVAASYDAGPVFIIVMIFVFMFCNLSNASKDSASSQPSAYAMFNQDGRELPGQLNAAQMDQMLRAGQL